MSGTSGTREKKRQIKARLEHEIDDALYAEIAPYGERHQLSDLIRLAVYRLVLPDDVPDDLRAFAAEFDVRDVDPVEKSPMMHTLVQLIELMVQRQQPAPMHNTAPREHEIESGGIDMSRPRKSGRPKASRGVTSADRLPTTDTLH